MGLLGVKEKGRTHRTYYLNYFYGWRQANNPNKEKKKHIYRCEVGTDRSFNDSTILVGAAQKTIMN